MAIYNYRTAFMCTDYHLSHETFPLCSSSWEASKRLLIKYISGSSSCWGWPLARGKKGSSGEKKNATLGTWTPAMWSVKPIIESCVLYYDTILLPFVTTSCNNLIVSIASQVTNLKLPDYPSCDPVRSLVSLLLSIELAMPHRPKTLEWCTVAKRSSCRAAARELLDLCSSSQTAQATPATSWCEIEVWKMC